MPLYDRHAGHLERPVVLLPGGLGRRRQSLGEDCGARAPQLRGTHPIVHSAMNALVHVRVGNSPQTQIFPVLYLKLGSYNSIVECEGWKPPMLTTITASPRDASQMVPGYILGGPGKGPQTQAPM